MWPILQNPWFYAALVGVALLKPAYSAWRRAPLLNMVKKDMLLMIGAIGFLAVGGWGLIAGSWGTGSFDSNPANGADITSFQITTAATSSCTVATASSSQEDVFNLFCLDAAVQDTNTEMNGTILTVTRDGDLSAASYPVIISSPDFQSEANPGDGTLYNLLEKNSLNQVAFFAASGGAATTSSPRARVDGYVTSLSFAEGDAEQTLGVLLNLDEEGIDALNTYGHRFVTMWVGDKAYTFDIQALD